MTKYRLDRDPDTGNPCMVADPDGIYYYAGEVDREIDRLLQIAPEHWEIPEWVHRVDGAWAYEAGTHDSGTVPEGDRPSPGPASAREDEGNPE